MSAKKEQAQISSYSRKLRENVKAILENYGEILKAAKVSDDDQQKTSEIQVAHVENEIEVRASNIVRAAESLSKLVSDLKEYLILNDFSTVNESCTQHISELAAAQRQSRAELEALYSQTAAAASGAGGAGGRAAQSQDLNSVGSQQQPQPQRTM